MSKTMDAASNVHAEEGTDEIADGFDLGSIPASWSVCGEVEDRDWFDLDYDYVLWSPPTSGTHTFELVWEGEGTDLDVAVRDLEGNTLVWDYLKGDAQPEYATLQLTAGQTVAIEVSHWEGDPASWTPSATRE